jgi:hypothetical protein
MDSMTECMEITGDVVSPVIEIYDDVANRSK